MKKGRRRTQNIREPATVKKHEANNSRSTAERKRKRTIVGLGICVLLATAAFAYFARFGADLDEFDSHAPIVVKDLDEEQIREVCSHCHRFPTPDVLPRASWNETVWQMFEESGYGTTVKWRVSPEDLVAWYEQRAPEQFTFPNVDSDYDNDRFALLEGRISVPPADSDTVVSNILVANVVGDHRPELLVCDMLNGRILMGHLGRTELEFELLANVANPAHVEATDVDADGRVDLVVANLGTYLAMDHNLGSVEWLRQTADGTFEQTTLLSGLGRVADVQPDDFDGDGDIDLVVAEFGWKATGHLLYLENQTSPGQPVSFERRDIDGLHGAIHVDVADLDGDGLRDLVVLYSQGHEMVRCYLQREGFSFSILDVFRAPNPAWGFSGMQLIDLDSDGDLDVLLSNGDTFDNSVLKPYHGVQWLENLGELQFEPHPIGSVFGTYRAEAADLDNDGDLDVVACAMIAPDSDALVHLGENVDSLVWFEQVAAGAFTRRSLESNQFRHPTIAVGDHDLDGDMDLFVGNGQLHFTVEATMRDCIDIWENQQSANDNSP